MLEIMSYHNAQPDVNNMYATIKTFLRPYISLILPYCFVVWVSIQTTLNSTREVYLQLAA